MELGIEGRVAIVTGSARGLGYAHCEALAKEGARLVMIDLDGAQVRESARRLRASGAEALDIAADATDPDAVLRAREQTLNEYGRIDILVNNAGIGMKPAYPVSDMPVPAWDQMLASHTRSTFLWSQAVLGPMGERHFGRIINTSSMHFTGGGRPGVAHYAAAKAAVAGFTQTLAKEVGAQGITVNAIAPGYVSTAMISQFSDDMMKRIKNQNPLGRLCRPEEVASLVAYLSSEQAAFINGELICIDGGRRDFVWN